MKHKTKLINFLIILITTALALSSCSEDTNMDYYPPVLKIGFEDISDITISNNEPNPTVGGADSTYVRIIKLVSDNSNNAIGADAFFNIYNPTSGTVDTTAINKYIRLMNPILKKDSLNTNGTRYGTVWSCSRAYFNVARTQAAIMIRTIDKVIGVPKTPGSPSQITFILKLIPDRNYPIRYTVDPAKNTKKVTVIDKKQL